MTQILRLPVLKYTHRKKKKKKKVKNKTKTKKQNKTKKKTQKNKTAPSSLPKKKRGQPQHPRRSSLRQQSRNRAVNCCRKDPHPRGCRYPRFSSFLCKCNLTKC